MLDTSTIKNKGSAKKAEKHEFQSANPKLVDLHFDRMVEADTLEKSLEVGKAALRTEAIKEWLGTKADIKTVVLKGVDKSIEFTFNSGFRTDVSKSVSEIETIIGKKEADASLKTDVIAVIKITEIDPENQQKFFDRLKALASEFGVEDILEVAKIVKPKAEMLDVLKKIPLDKAIQVDALLKVPSTCKRSA